MNAIPTWPYYCSYCYWHDGYYDYYTWRCAWRERPLRSIRNITLCRKPVQCSKPALISCEGGLVTASSCNVR